MAANLRDRLEQLDEEDSWKMASMCLPLIQESIADKLAQIRKQGLPIDEDALKDISSCLPFDRPTIQQAISVLDPLQAKRVSLAQLADEIEILEREKVDLLEQQHLGLYLVGIEVRHIETQAERQEQTQKLVQLDEKLQALSQRQVAANKEYEQEAEVLKAKIKEDLHVIEPQILTDLEDTQRLVANALAAGELPTDGETQARLIDLILKRQLRALKDIANHALVVEQSAIAPLTMGIIHYKRYREIQEAMTTFINDEAKHSATFRRFLVEKLEAKEYISALLIKGANRYMWLARLMPGMGMFLAVIVEAIGAAYLEFFAEEKYMPDKLFRGICETISTKDEQRHMDLCVAMYNELFRKGGWLERTQNRIALKVLMQSVYGDKTDNHHLIQAFRAFGVSSDTLYNHIMGRLSYQLSRISVYVKPQELMQFIGR